MLLVIHSRQRVERALAFLSVDRVPVDLNLSLNAYYELAKLVGFNAPLPKPSLAMEVCPEPAFYEKLGVDVYSVKFGIGTAFNGVLEESVTDAWGIPYRLVEQESGSLYEVSGHPLAHATVDDLESYPWPAAPSAAMKASLREQAEHIYESTNLALCGRFGAPIMETAVGLLGFEEWFVRLMTEPEFTQMLLEKIASVATAWDLAGIDACGDFLSIMKVSGEDFGTQQSLLYSPETIREFLLPILRRRWDAVHVALDACGSEAKVMLHTCGAVRPIIADLIEAGIEVLDPIQPRAANMDPTGLYEAFGAQIVFHGGIDVQEILPNGSVEQVKEHAGSVIAALHGSDGGYICAPSHTVQADVPVKNLIAMLESVRD